MKPTRTLIQQKMLKNFIKLETALCKASKGKFARSAFLPVLDIPYVGSSVKIIIATETSTFIAKYNDDGTIDNGDFKILATTDMHTDEDFTLNNKTYQLLINQIRDEKPDLVILTGDCIQSKFQHIEAVQFAQMMEKLGVYWAYVFGNPNLFGFGNFIVNIMNSETEIKQSLVFFDSGRDIIPEYMERDGVPAEMKGGYDYIKPDQIKWYTDEIDALKSEYGKAPNLLYMHIPIKEYEEVFTLNENGEFIPSGKAEILFGEMHESVGCSPFNSGLFEAMKKNEAQGIFAGHDHVNDWAAKYEGIWLVYNQPGTYNAYTMADYNGVSRPEKDWPQGVTITTIHSDRSIDLSRSFNSRYL